MKNILFPLFVIFSLCACKLSNTNQGKGDNKELSSLLNNYYEERLRLFPLEATAIGDLRYNDLLPVDFSDAYRDTLKDFYSRYFTYLGKYERENLNDQDKLSYDDFKREMQINREGLDYPDNYIPFHQFWGVPLTMGQLGSGTGNQPF